MDINRCQDSGREYVTSIIHYGQQFFTLLMLVAAVADTRAPFFATALLPSP